MAPLASVSKEKAESKMRKIGMLKNSRYKAAWMAVLVCILCGCSGSGQEALTTDKAASEMGKLTTDKAASETEKAATKEVFAMDTVMSLTAYGESAQQAVDEAEKEIQRLDALLSVGSEDSEISVANNTGSEYVSEDTAFIIKKSIELYQSTKGAFDITIYPLMEEWGFTTQKYKVPDEERISELLKNVDASRIEFNESSKLIRLPDAVKIDLGGIAKGYTSDRIMEIYEKYHVTSGKVSLGGNIQVYSTKTDGTPWRVAVEDPDDAGSYLGIVSVKDKAVITSGGYERYFEEGGKRYHHIIDPDTGYPAENGLKSVTIISGDGIWADGLSTSLFVMGKERALEYWKENSSKFDAVLEDEDGQITITKGIEDCFTSDFEYEVAE